jgi:hypothetical protein
LYIITVTPEIDVMAKVESSFLTPGEIRQRVFSLALWKGIKWGTGAVIASGIGTLYAMRSYKAFNKFASASAKTSIPVLFGMSAFCLPYILYGDDMMR